MACRIRVLMPEAAMDEHHKPAPWEYQIRATGQVGPVKAKAQPGSMCCLSNEQFWLGIFPLDRRHDTAPDVRRKDSRQSLHRVVVPSECWTIRLLVGIFQRTSST
jgi:hypothetical protein